jgi:prolyl-tRNA editing enzyme YbaK/EbsC (Cys-tRNA(Pro) deacylase)
VSPFGIKNPVRVLIDESVLREEEVSTGSGARHIAIIMKSVDLRRALSESEVVSLLESA